LLDGRKNKYVPVAGSCDKESNKKKILLKIKHEVEENRNKYSCIDQRWFLVMA